MEFLDICTVRLMETIWTAAQQGHLKKGEKFHLLKPERLLKQEKKEPEPEGRFVQDGRNVRLEGTFRMRGSNRGRR